MKPSEYAVLDATALAELIQKREVTADEALEAAIQAVDIVNPRINAITYKAYDEARRQIKEELDPGAPFSGAPMLLKDCGAIAKGIPSTSGSRLIKWQTTDEDTEIVKRFKKAGFIIFGTTNTPECCFTNTTESILHGPTRNPWDPGRIPGGSSGGSAAAVISGIAPVAHGTDGGGSIRQPSSCCGVVGLKPSRFRIPNSPGHGDMLSGLGSSFALTRSVRDAARILDAIHGPDRGYYGMAAPSDDTFYNKTRVDPAPLRIAYMARYPLGAQMENKECLEALMKAVSLLTDLGHHVTEAYPEVDARIHWARETIQAAGIAAQLDSASQSQRRPINGDYVEGMILETYYKGKSAKATDFLQALEINNIISRSMGLFMEDYDIIVCPTMGTLPCPIGEIDANQHPEWDYERWRAQKSRFSHFTNLFNATGQPSMSIPLYESSQGLPIGIELSGKLGDDATVLALAAQLERAENWKDRRPGVHVLA